LSRYFPLSKIFLDIVVFISKFPEVSGTPVKEYFASMLSLAVPRGSRSDIMGVPSAFVTEICTASLPRSFFSITLPEITI